MQAESLISLLIARLNRLLEKAKSTVKWLRDFAVLYFYLFCGKELI